MAQRGRPRKNPLPVDSGQTAQQTAPATPNTAVSDLAEALRQAIQQSQPAGKKTAFNKRSGSPWMPKDGSPKLRLKRKAYHHGLLLGDPTEPNNRLSNEEIALFNKLKPGKYCDGYVTVARRRDKGIDIDYPIRTASQRLRLVNDFGIRSFTELLQRCIEEASQPKRTSFDEDE